MRYLEICLNLSITAVIIFLLLLLPTLLFLHLTFWFKKLYKFGWYKKIYYIQIFNTHYKSHKFIKFFTGFFQHDLYAETISKLLNKICNFISFALYDKYLFKWLNKKWHRYITNLIQSTQLYYTPIRLIQLAILYNIIFIVLAAFFIINA